MIFRRHPTVTEEVRDWLVEALSWSAQQELLREDTPLVLPTSEFITAPSGRSETDTAKALLLDVLRLVKMEGAAIDLHPIEVLPDELRHQWGQTSDIAGTWQADENKALIRYDPTLLRRPVLFLSVLAHEVMHERMSWLPRDWPGAPATEELMTDLSAIASGFGVLQLAGAETAGWSGYLRQESRAYALALVLRVTGRDPDAALGYLPPRSAKGLKRALSEVDGRPSDLDLLRAEIA